jgi:hypothetical protein
MPPTTTQAKQKEWNIIHTTVKNNVFPLQIIHKLKNNRILKHKKQRSHPHKHNKRKNRSPSQITVHSHTK